MSTMRGREFSSRTRRPPLYIDLEPEHKLACRAHRYKLKRPAIVLDPQAFIYLYHGRGWDTCEVVDGCELV